MGSSDAYETLAATLGYPGSTRLRPVLEDLMTPEQAQMVAELPGSPAEVAERAGFSEDQVRQDLGELAMTGVVSPKGGIGHDDYFYFPRQITHFLDSTTGTQKKDIVKDKAFFERWQEFCIHEMYPAVGRATAKLEAPPMRVVPAYHAIKDLPGVDPSEDFRELLKAQRRISVIPCPCRQRHTAAGTPCEHTDINTSWKCFQFGAASDAVIARGAGREVSLEEALEILEDVEADGLVHTWPNTNTQGASFSCQCCRDCCLMYVPLDVVDESIGKMWAKSRFEAVVDTDKCDGCQNCVVQCQFDAIDMVKPPKQAKARGKSSKKLKALIDSDKCWVCGVCVIACEESDAMGFKEVRPLEHIPLAV